MKIPKTITSHAGIKTVVLGEDQGSDCKYWIFLQVDWGYYEHGQRQDCCWICGGFGVDSVAEFKKIRLEKK